MKTYIKPQTEYIETIYGSVICHSNDGEGATVTPAPPSGQPGAAPWRY